MNPTEKEAWAVVGVYKGEFCSAVDRPDVESWRCPWCDGTLNLSVSPDRMAVFLGCENYSKLGSCSSYLAATVDLDTPREWHSEFVTDDWLIDDE